MMIFDKIDYIEVEPSLIVAFLGIRYIQQSLRVYVQDANIANFAYAENLPSLTELTFCMWLKAVGNYYNQEHLISIAVAPPGELK